MPFNENNLRDLLLVAIKNNASDIHIRVDEPPILRINGQLLPIKTDSFKMTDITGICKIITGKDNINNETDGSYELKNICRLRYNIFKYSQKLGIVFRIISAKIPSFADLKLPPILQKIAHQKNGLILITGATGQGKSTTLAAIIDYINTNFSRHIITLEDPIEYFHTTKKSYITQREIGIDTINFSTALKSSLRQDPDIIMVGEMRDTETMITALNASETGHLVLGTMHTSNTITTIGRIFSMFELDQIDDIKKRLSENLYATIGQKLIPSLNGNFALATEIMISNLNIKDAILGSISLDSINKYIQKGEANEGTQTFDQSIYKLYKANIISREMAIEYASFPADFEQRLLTDDDNA